MRFTGIRHTEIQRFPHMPLSTVKPPSSGITEGGEVVLDEFPEPERIERFQQYV